jgi:hypothetical protein
VLSKARSYLQPSLVICLSLESRVGLALTMCRLIVVLATGLLTFVQVLLLSLLIVLLVPLAILEDRLLLP